MSRVLKVVFLLFGLASIPSCDKAAGLTSLIKSKVKPAEPSAAYSGPIVSEVSASNHDSFANQKSRVAVVVFTASWCGPCRQLSPILESIGKEHGGVVLIGKADVDACADLAKREGVNGIPDVRIYRDGRLVDKFVGLPPIDEVKAMISKHAKGLPKPSASDHPPTTPSKPAIEPASKDWLPPGMQRR